MGLPAGGAYVVFIGVLGWAIICVGIHAVFSEYKVTEASVKDGFWWRLAKSKGCWYRGAFFVVCAAWGMPNFLASCKGCGVGEPDFCGNGLVLWTYGVVFIGISSVATRPREFYLGEGRSLREVLDFYLRGKEPPNLNQPAAAAAETISAGSREQRPLAFRTLTPSVFVSWVFATSIRNAAVLGGEYGMLGGLAYASWYVSFLTVGVVCYLLRTRYNFESLSTAVFHNYGAPGVLCFQLAAMFRCWSTIWSNATVVGGFFGPEGSIGWWGAAWLATLIPFTCACLGGMRAALVGGVVRAFVIVLFLLIVLINIGSDAEFRQVAESAFSYRPSALYQAEVGGPGWRGGWWACALGGAVQGLCSYPFFDPSLTDRGFLSSPKTMLASFFTAGFFAAWFILFYAAIGVYGAYYNELYQSQCGCGAAAPVALPSCPTSWNPCHLWSTVAGDPAYAAYVLGRKSYRAVEVFIAVTMITAAMSSLDSAFTSWCKLSSLDFGGWCRLEGDTREEVGPLRPQDTGNIGPAHMLVARASCAFLGIASMVFLGVEKDAMAATSAGGTMVMGLGAPIWAMTLWRTKREGRRGWVQAPLAFVAPFAVGLAIGALYYVEGKNGSGVSYQFLALGPHSSSYSRFLGVNVWGHLICFGVFLACFAFHQLLPRAWFWPLQEVEPLQR